MNNPESDKTYLNFAIELAKDVGLLLREHLQKGPTYKLKSSHQDLVTEADKAAEKLIIERIQKKYPDHGILSEESPELVTKKGFRWVIDPIDGTTNFAHGIPFFCTSIALEENGKLVAGVILDPVKDELFAASLGGGAWLNGQPLKVSSTNQLKRSLLGFGYPFHEELIDLYMLQMRKFVPVSQGLRRLGSAALCLAYVAAGRLEGYWDLNLNRWDLAAGVLLVAEAGGHVSDLNARELALDTRALVASNSRIHGEMIRVLGE